MPDGPLMMKVVLDVEPAAADDFGRVARQWVADTAGESGVLTFVSAFDPEASQGTFVEVYADSASFLAHAAAVDPALRSELYSFARLHSYDVYGDLSDEARAAVDGAGPTYHRIEAAHIAG
ncbi:antibiotic biosynthesis monooxygenase [Nocardioides humi]|uniref:ABM domain-containing protein n=1 Tax=Nocardioides humi TaxID=449461 RepID=A0ABN2BVW8_9ACTN|nr:antibiotic biosynthesis monooxygenase [Nocardioides humi]